MTLREKIVSDMKSDAQGCLLTIINISILIILGIPFWLGIIFYLNLPDDLEGTAPYFVLWSLFTFAHLYFGTKIIDYYAKKAGLVRSPFTGYLD